MTKENGGSVKTRKNNLPLKKTYYRDQRKIKKKKNKLLRILEKMSVNF